MRRRKSGYYEIDIRDQRLAGGRLSISARTKKAPVARRREAAVRRLLERGDTGVIQRIRSGDIHIADVERAVTEGDYDRLRRPPDLDLSLGALVDDALQLIEATRTHGTLKQYQVVARQLIREWGEDYDVTQLTRADAEEFLHRKRDGKPWSARTQNQKAALAGKIWQVAIDREQEAAERAQTRPRLRRNPWRDAEVPEVVPTRFAFLQPEEWRDVMAVAEGLPVAAPLALGCLVGLRVSETRHLRRDVDVDLGGRRIRVQPRMGEHPWQPKNMPRGERDLRIGDELHAVLSEHVGLGYAGERYLVCTEYHDRPVHPGTIARWTEEAFKAAGIEYGRAGDGLTYHSLRHTFASWLVQRDVQLKKVAELLGDTAEMVDKTYGHLLPSDLDRAVDLVDSVAKGGA